MKKWIIALFLIFLVGCSFQKGKDKKEESNPNSSEDSYLFVVLSMNMPLQYDDLDELFEFPMMDYLEEHAIGEIIRDGFPIDEFGPYATDIEFYIDNKKWNQFKTMLENYEFPKGSYLDKEGVKEDLSSNILGVRLQFSNLSNEEILNLYLKLSDTLKDSYTYKTMIELETSKFIYYYGKDRESLKKKIEEELTHQKLTEKVTIIDMPMTIKEMEK